VTRIKSYCVYEKDYQPGRRYKTNIRTLDDARRWARKFGPGAEIVRWYEAVNKRGDTHHWADQREWTYCAPTPGRYRKK
jgi:hypothetical protein